MQYEFDQLLEDLWDGRLDEAGRRRLEDLCAADPRLAARYRQERNLTGLLKQCGPNHAPDDLVRSVMGRLETRVRIRPARPWYWWMMEPAFRTAFAAVVLLALGVELGLLIANKKDASRQFAAVPAQSAAPETMEFMPQVPDPDTQAPARGQAPAIGRKTSARKAQSAESTRRKALPGETVVAMNVPATPAPTPAPRLEPFPTPSPSGNAGQPAPDSLSAFPVIIQSPLAPAVPSPSPTATPKATIPEVKIPAETRLAQAKAAPLSLADRQVAMRISLNPNAVPLPSAKADESPANPLPPTAQTFVPPSQARPRQEALTHKEVETALFAVPGVLEKDVTYGPVPGDPRKWQVRAWLTSTQFRSFVSELRKTGIGPSPAVTASTPEEAAERRKQPPSGMRNLYDITQGRQWMQPQARPRVSLVPATQPAGTTSTSARSTENGSAEKLEVTIIIEQVDGLLSTH